jgi:hypothetical protein
MSNIEIVLAGPASEETRMTDENGEATFVLKDYGEYTATFWSGDTRVGVLNIKLRD